MFDIRTEVDLENMQPFGGNTEGKNSTVFLADDKQLKHQFIVKKISKESIYQDYKSNDESNLFLESSILYEVSHPNIAEIQYASSDDNFVYLVMPHYKNGSIQSLLKTRNLTVREFIKYSLDFLSGLLFVHSKKLVHFDIKPTNILINNNGKAVLTDFGLAKYLDHYTELAKPNKLYTLHWPPEYNISIPIGHQADIYQAGMTMYRMINGDAIWEEQCTQFNRSKVLNGTFPDRKCYLPHIPAKIRKIINCCLAIDVDKRYDSVLDIINELSLIDGNLDWIYTKSSSMKEEWRNNQEKMEIRIALEYDGNTYNLETTKTNCESGRCSKVSTMCKKNLSKEEAYKMITDYTK